MISPAAMENRISRGGTIHRVTRCLCSNFVDPDTFPYGYPMLWDFEMPAMELCLDETDVRQIWRLLGPLRVWSLDRAGPHAKPLPDIYNT